MALDKDILERLGLNAQLVYDETKASANTHTRVGQAFIDTHELFEEVENDESDIAQLQKDVASVKTDLTSLGEKEASDIASVNATITALGEKEASDIASVNATITALGEKEASDIKAVNEKIDAITPRLILPLYGIDPNEVEIITSGVVTEGVAVWCSVNGCFAWHAKTGSFFSTNYYGAWDAYGVYPDSNMYTSEIGAGVINREVWYYVQSEGAFYYWNGSEMEKITNIDFATQSDLAKKQDTLTAGEGITIENNTITADLTNIVPTALLLEYPESISLQNLEAKQIVASLLPEGIIQNIVFLTKGESIEVGLFGDITLLGAGTTRVRVIPTCNTALAKEISISVLDRPLRLVSASSMRLTGSGNLRFY